MSEHIVHAAVMEDSFALLLGSNMISDGVRSALNTKLNMGKMGSETIAGFKFSFTVLKDLKAQPVKDEYYWAKLAFVLGWVSHRTTDLEMKPVWMEAKLKKGILAVPHDDGIMDASVYDEACIFNNYYKEDKAYEGSIFPEKLKELPEAKYINMEKTEEYVRKALSADLLSIQTIDPVLPNWEYNSILEYRRQIFYVDLERYRKAIADPDPDLYRISIEEMNWYDENEPILKVANALRNGRTVSAEECEAAVAEEPDSYYARAVWSSVKYFLHIFKYLENEEMTFAELKAGMDIGPKVQGGYAL